MPDMEQSDGAILRTDAQGRVHTPAARRESLLDEFERSGLSGAKFAALAGIKYQTFLPRGRPGGANWVWPRLRPSQPIPCGGWKPWCGRHKLPRSITLARLFCDYPAGRTWKWRI
jgi:hypothetical protein